MRPTNPDRFVRQVCERIAQLRLERGWTQAEAAERFQVALRGWQRLEAGQNLTLHSLARIANLFGVPPIELLSDGVPPAVQMVANKTKRRPKSR